jgi:hypothetical protein
MDTKQVDILTRMQNAEPDNNNFTYFSVNHGTCIFKVDKQWLLLANITQHNENIHQGGIVMPLYQIHGVHRYLNEQFIEIPYAWLHSICDVYTIEEVKSYAWGNNVEHKIYYSLYRFILFKLFLQSYTNDLRHRMWQPGTIHVARLEERFNKYALISMA